MCVCACVCVCVSERERERERERARTHVVVDICCLSDHTFVRCCISRSLCSVGGGDDAEGFGFNS